MKKLNVLFLFLAGIVLSVTAIADEIRLTTVMPSGAGIWKKVAFPNDNDIYYDQGDVGIGTATPEFRLTLDKGAASPDGGILAIGTLNSGASLADVGATIGEGTRLMWYPRKAAFRAGTVGGGAGWSDAWNDENIGLYSVAMGFSPKANGINSIAMGYRTVAKGDYSVALGQQAQATGPRSIAIGSLAGAGVAGPDSIAIGSYAEAKSSYSIAMGYSVSASAPSNITIGQGADESSPMVNSIASSLMVGFKSDVPTLFIGPSSGTGTTGNVGIGTKIPVARLHINPTVAATADAKMLQSGIVYNGATAMANWYGAYITAPTGTGTITNKYALVTEANAGNVGIGTTGPNSKLVVYDSTSGAGANALKLYNNTGTYSETGIGLYANAQAGATDVILGRIYGKYDASGFGNQRITFQVADSLGANQDVLSLKSSGNVGIGTTDPTSKLQVVGLPEYADNTAAKNVGLLTNGAFYRTGDVLKVVHE